MNDPATHPGGIQDAAVELLSRTRDRGTFRVTAGDTSMVPTLVGGQRFVVHFATDRPRRGDILLFRQVDYHAVHRLLGPARNRGGRGGWRTRGDGRIGLDPVVESDQIVGRVIAILDERGWWSLETGRARTYARAVAWHDLSWAAVGAAAAVLDRGICRVGLRLRSRDLAQWVDRMLLRLVHRVLFRFVHSTTFEGAPVVEAGPGTPSAS